MGRSAALVLLTALVQVQGASGETRPPPRPAEWPRTAPPEPARESPSPQPAPSDAAATPAPAPAATCLASLRQRYGPDLRAVALPAVEAGCTVVEPVEISALSIRVGRQGERRKVDLQPPVTLACDMATTVATWVETSLQPLARGHYGLDLSALRVGGGHECRRRNRRSEGPLSEHATGRALDVFAIGIGSGTERLSVEMAKPGGHEAFFTGLRHSACGAFLTALGPGSDPTHQDHLHVDIQPRRASSRFCQ